MEPRTTRDVYNIVTDTIIEQLEKGIIPWKQPWRNTGVPRNLVTQRPYRGLNQLLLTTLNYSQSEFLTFNQVQQLGGRVKRGEKAHLVILWVWVDEKGMDRMHELKGRKWPLLRYYYVFNVTQCAGLPIHEEVFEVNANTPIEKCEAIVANMPNCPNIMHHFKDAFYNPEEDYVNMPKMEVFGTSHEYYATLFHELIHATGHESRLNRRTPEHNEFGSKSYSIEELTAEIGTCYLTSHAGIAVNVLANNVAYIQHWLGRLKSDKKFVVHASAYAQNAVDYILNIKFEENDPVSHMQKEVV